MQFRKVLLRIMLASLGVAAVVGALAILTAEQTIIWRVVGTAMATALASALIMGMSLLADHEKTRSAGMLGMGAVVTEFLLCLSAIWELGYHLVGDWHYEESCLISMFMTFLIAPPAMLFLRLRHVPLGRIAANTGLALCAVVFAITMAAAWRSRIFYYSRVTEDCWETAGALSAFGVAAVACLVGIGMDRRYWRYLGLAACAAGLAMALVAIWRHIHEGSAIFTIVCSTAGVVAHANLAMLCPLKPGQLWLRYGTILCVLLTAIFIDVDAVLHPGSSSDTLMRMAGASGFVAACGSLALLVLARLNQRMGQTRVLTEIKEITVICPGCQKKHTLAVGAAQCPTCNLRIHTRIEEPRCPNCDYLLYMLTSDRCPECGEPVRGAGATFG